MENYSTCFGCGLPNCSGQCGWDTTEPVEVHICQDCCSGIYEGEEFLMLGDKAFCFSCVENWGAWEICNNLGNPMVQATRGG